MGDAAGTAADFDGGAAEAGFVLPPARLEVAPVLTPKPVERLIVPGTTGSLVRCHRVQRIILAEPAPLIGRLHGRTLDVAGSPARHARAADRRRQKRGRLQTPQPRDCQPLALIYP